MSRAPEIAVTARRDLLEITLWLRDNRSPAVADRWLAGGLASIGTLAENPLRHPLAEGNDRFPEEIRLFLHGKGGRQVPDRLHHPGDHGRHPRRPACGPRRPGTLTPVPDPAGDPGDGIGRRAKGRMRTGAGKRNYQRASLR